jgi:hypothetical protein
VILVNEVGVGEGVEVEESEEREFEGNEGVLNGDGELLRLDVIYEQTEESQ